MDPTRLGRASTGHPVDIGTGAVFFTRLDIVIPGKVPLVWERRYCTSLLGSKPSVLGPGWTCRYFGILTRHDGQLLFAMPEGGVDVFDDPHHQVDRGEVVRNLGSFQEISKTHDRFIVTRWDVDSSRVERYVFQAGPDAHPSPLSSIENECGLGVDLAYDSSGRLSIITQRLEGRALMCEYNSYSQISSVTFVASGNQTQPLVRYEYDAAGRLCTATDARGHTDRYEYDREGRLVREILKDGGVFTFRYDSKGRCVRTAGLDRYDEKRLRYFDAARWTEVTDSYGKAARYECLPSGQIVTAIDALGGIVRTQYDDLGRMVGRSDELGGVRTYEYDPFGNRCKTTDALGCAFEMTFNEQHLPLTLQDPRGAVWKCEYDGGNRVIAAENPVGQRWTMMYDHLGRLVKTTAPNANYILVDYSTSAVYLKNSQGSVTTQEYDLFGRLNRQTDPSGNTMVFHYDLIGNVTLVELPDGSSTSFEYDSVGNRTKIVSLEGSTREFRFGPCGRLLEARDPLGQRVRYLWGSEPRRLEGVVNERGEEWTFLYDSCGRLVEESSFDGRRSVFEYDAGGRCRAIARAPDVRVEYERDKLGRLISKRAPDGSEETYEYDAAGYLISARNATSEVRFERDLLGRIVKEVQGPFVLECRYDPADRQLVVESNRGATLLFRFDSNRLLVQTTINDMGWLSIERDLRGRETACVMSTGYRLEQRWSATGRLIEQHLLRKQSLSAVGSLQREPRVEQLLSRHYSYNPAGNLADVVDSRHGTTRYEYDAASRVVRVKSAEATQVFEYDGCGDLLAVTEGGVRDVFRYSRGGRLTQDSRASYEYDACGRMVRRMVRRAGEETQHWSYSWDSYDRLREIKRPDGIVWRYRYDALGRRVGKETPTSKYQILWYGSTVLHEVVDDRMQWTWLFDPHSFRPLGLIEKNRFRSLVCDHLGSPTAVCSPGEILRTVKRNIWGERIVGETGDVALPLHFPGQWFDEETGFFYNSFRYYDPRSGRYISQDPLRLRAGLNLYAYTTNPVNQIDPMGLNPEDIALGLSNPPVQTPLGTFPQPDGLFHFANSVGATPYTGFDPQLGGRNGTSVYLAMQDANTIHFNLDGLPTDPAQMSAFLQSGRDGLPQGGTFTAWELSAIMDDPELLAKTTFYRNGEEIEDPPELCAG